MKILSFNINSIRARLHQLEAIVNTHQPDVIGLQETKVSDEQFPIKDVEALGYHVAFHGQKGHYGVAMLTKNIPLNVIKGMSTDEAEAQRRLVSTLLESEQGNVWVVNGYFPQGESRDHPTKFPAKEKFYADLQEHLSLLLKESSHLVVMGDFNISPQDIDIGIGPNNAKRWLRTGKCSFLPEEREWYQRMLSLGLFDSYRIKHPESSELYSWFDYRSKGFDDDPKRGLRIDHVLVSETLEPHIKEVGIDYIARAMEKPSDHCPVWTKLSI
ncbi:MAG: exodeoxyribonuclease III [Pseudomonadota bacterium]